MSASELRDAMTLPPVSCLTVGFLCRPLTLENRFPKPKILAFPQALSPVSPAGRAAEEQGSPSSFLDGGGATSHLTTSFFACP